MMRLLLLSAALLAIGQAAHAQTIKDIEGEETKLEALWQSMPLTLHRSLFITGDPAAYGMYTERATRTFKPGEPLLIYVEPVGYRWKDEGNGLFSFGISADALILDKSRKVIGGKEEIAHKLYRSHVRNKELMLTLRLNLTGAVAGDYIAEYRLHDLISGQTTTAELPFTISAE